MKESDASHLIVGKIGTPYGVHGWVKIHAYTEDYLSLLDYNPWQLLSSKGDLVAYTIEEGRMHNNGLIVKFAGIESPEAVRLLTNMEIHVARELLPPLKAEEYYWSDLEGLTVINQRGEVLGKIIYILETGANDVLVVKGDREHAIPYLPHVVKSVNLEKREIHVDWEII